MMKTTTILFFTAAALFLIFIPSATNAQFAKGDMLVEGGLGNIKVSKKKDQYETIGLPGVSKSEDKQFSIAIFPRVGFFLSKNLVIGTTLGINYTTDNHTASSYITGQKSNDQKSSVLLLDLAPFVRYYFAGNAKTRFYGQVGGGISVTLSQKNEGKYYDSFGAVTNTYKTDYDKKYNAFSAEALVGVNHFVSQNVAVNAALGYNYSKSTMTAHNVYTPPNFTEYPQKHTIKTGAVVWNVGFTMIIPCMKKKK